MASSLPIELAYFGPLNTESRLRPTQLVVKGPETSSVTIQGNNSATNSSMVFNNIMPPSDLTVTWREIAIRYSVMVRVTTNVRPTTSVLSGEDVLALPGNIVIGQIRAGCFNAAGVGSVVTAVGESQKLNDLSYLVSAAAANQWGSSAGGAAITYKYVPGLALRSFPLQSVTNTLDFRINGQSTTVPSAELVPLYPYLEDISISRDSMGSCPFYRQEGVIPAQGNIFESYFTNNTLYGSQRIAQSSGDQFTHPLGQQVWYLRNYCVTAGVVCEFIFEVPITEPLVISPLRFGATYYEAGLVRVQSLNFTLNYSNLQRMLLVSPETQAVSTFEVSLLPMMSGAGAVAGPAAALISPVIHASPEIVLQQSYPDQVTALRTPQFVIYDYHALQLYTTPTVLTSTAIAAPNTPTIQTTQTVSSTFRLPAIPKKIYIFVRPSRAWVNTTATSYNVTDHFLRITRINLTYNNRIGLLSNHTEESLWKMSKKNGVDMSFDEWRFEYGSLLCIDLAEDSCLSLNEAPGQQQQTTITWTLTYDTSVALYQSTANYLTTKTVLPIPAIQYEMMMLASTPGQCVIGGGQCSFLTSGPTEQQVIELMTQAGLRTEVKDAPAPVSGGSFDNTSHLNPTPMDAGGDLSGGVMTAGGFSRS